jgi:hypothetical protein
VLRRRNGRPRLIQAAYALKGFSAHVGHPIFDGKLRLQFGAFGAETPEWIHGNIGFAEDSRGVTFKCDYFPLRPLDGLFVGADSNYSRVRYALEATHERTYRNISEHCRAWAARRLSRQLC